MEELGVNYLEDLLRSLIDRGVRFVVAGGVAIERRLREEEPHG